MRKTKRFLWNSLLVLGMICLVLLASGSARADSPYNIEGSNGSKVFYVTANGSCTLTFAQDYGTFMYQTGATTAKGWGRFHISYSLGGSYKYNLDWKRDTGTSTFMMTLPQAGQYTITVTPYTTAEMRTEVSAFGYWTSYPSWSLTGVSNGTASLTAPVSSKSVQVYYKDFSGNVLQTRTVSCKTGANSVTAPSTITYGGAQYTLVSAATQTVTLYSGGTLSPASLTFYYNRTSTPTPVPKANCTVYYKDFSGSILQTRLVSCSVGSNTISAPGSITYGGASYNLASAGSQTVTMNAAGVLSPTSVTFYYSKVATPTPKPVTANLTVYYRDFSGSILQTRIVTCTQGTNNITAPSSVTYGGAQYTLSGSSTQTVTLYSSGNMSATSVTFFYSKVATPTPMPTSATCMVYYYDSTGRNLSSRSVTCTLGTNNITAPSSVTYGGAQYDLISPATQTVTMYSNGSLSANSLSFYYSKRATPTPYVPTTAECTVYYRTSSGNILQTRSVTCTMGNNNVTAPGTLTYSGVQYNLISPATQTVTMYSNGALSTNSVTFYYSQQAATGAVTIRQIDTASRATITSRTETLSTGTHTVYAGSTPSGYTPVGSTSATVTVTSTGAVSPSVVTFEYKRNGSVDPITPPPSAGGRVYPSSWDTQFKPGTSKSERSISTLPRIEDDSLYTSFYYTMWSSEKSDDIPELTAFFNGQTVSSIGIVPGDVTSESSYYNKAKPCNATVVVTCDQGRVTKDITIRVGYTTKEQTFSLGTCTGVTRIDIFFRGVNIGQDGDTKYEVHVSELHFYN